MTGDISKWASPERRRLDNSHLPFIANEIYLEIFDYFVSSPRILSESECNAIIRNLVLVCRFFYQVCVPRLLKTVTFDAGLQWDGSQSRNRVDWCGEIIDNNKTALSLAAFVKTCRISQWDSVGLTTHTRSSHRLFKSALLTRRAEAVSRFQNLESLYLDRVPITQPFFLSVIAKDNLKSVSIIRCEFASLEQEWNLDRFKPQWSSIHVNHCTVFRMRPYVIPLSILASGQNLQICGVDDDYLADAIFSQPVQFDQLRELHVCRPTMLETFLERTPSIITLHCSLSEYASRAMSHNCLPSIQEVACIFGIRRPDQIFQELVARTSLRRIGVSFSSHSEENFQMVWELLQRAGPNVEHVDITDVFYGFAPLSTKFHVLDTLEIEQNSVHSWRNDVKNLCDKWPDHPKARLLIFKSVLQVVPWLNLNLREQHDNLIQYVSKAFPQTKTVQFPPYFEWSMKGSRWKVEVMDRYALKQELARVATSVMEVDVEDFEGTLVDLHNEGELKNLALRLLLGLNGL